MKTIAEFDTCYLEPIMRFADQGGVREQMVGMQVFPAAKGGVILAATNGHVAILARDPTGKMIGTKPSVFAPEPSLIEASVAHPGERLLLTDAGLALIAGRSAPTAGESAIDNCLTVGKARLIKGDPLDIVGTVPEGLEANAEGASSFFINTQYVGMFSDSFSAMAGLDRDGWEGVELRCEPPVIGHPIRKIVVLPMASHVEAIGVIMNMRADPVTYTKDWMQARTKPRVRVVQGGRFVA